MTDSAKCHAPAAQRNREPIAAVLERFLPTTGLVLEVASGTGEHAVHFAQRFPALTWQPTDFGDEQLASIDAWVSESALPNLRPPLRLDVSSPQWPVDKADALLAINILQVTPVERCEQLFEGAARTLPPGGLCFIYSPLKIDGQHISEGNAQFDADLQRRYPGCGLRDAAEVETIATERGFELLERVAMPANNTSLAFRRFTG
jgi:cyclopropane fatty-acyl-phospholipid synthase-like methyltransferase